MGPPDKDEKEVKPEPGMISVAEVSLVEFLESTPPNEQVAVPDLAARKQAGVITIDVIRTPEIQIHCSNEPCNGLRFFRYVGGGGDAEKLVQMKFRFIYLTYRCSNCQKIGKTFALAVMLHADAKPGGRGFKLGESPAFGPPTPARLITLIGPDRDEFLKGRRCENQGLGVGAFTYYRRVVERQKDRIISEIIQVAERIGAPPDAIEELKAARAETQFSKALGAVKSSIPQILLINGHNPLTLLYGALSDGMHDRSDEECLELASSVRIVLTELSDRLGQALKDEVAITKALGTLMNRSRRNS